MELLEIDAIEEIILGEDASTAPLMEDRSSGLAVECWNLRKNIFDQNSELLKQKQQLQRLKNLTKNLQQINNAKDNEISLKNTEMVLLKQLQLDLERKNQALNTTVSQQTLYASKTKKQLDSFASKNSSLQAEIVSVNSK